MINKLLHNPDGKLVSCWVKDADQDLPVNEQFWVSYSDAEYQYMLKVCKNSGLEFNDEIIDQL